MDTIIPALHHWFAEWGLAPTWASLATRTALVAGVALLAWLANSVTKRILLTVVQHLIQRTTFTWDDVFVKRRVFERASHLAPALVIYVLTDLAFFGMEGLIQFTRSAATIYTVVVLMLVADGSLNALKDIYGRFEVSERVPLAGIVQAVKVLAVFLGGIFILSVVLGKSPTYLFSGLGALTAVLLLVFKDTILGFVGSIQLSANNMVRVGDWIEIPAHGADGDVLDISLTSVKVQNFDKTIITIPTYSLVSGSFKNWRGMGESEGRRIKRSFNVDIGSIRFCDDAMLERFSQIDLLKDYLAQKRTELAEHNEARGLVDATIAVNLRRLTNIGTFRAYMLAYLKDHPMIHNEMTFLVRQLPIGEHGLPIQVYVFSNDKVWAHYEAIQADIFDHLVAAAPEFGLRIFQHPTGADFRALATRVATHADDDARSM